MQHGGDHQACEIGKGVARLSAGDRARQEPDADQEAMLGGEDAQTIERLLIMAGMIDKGCEAGGQIVVGRQFGQEPRVQHAIKDMRP